MLEAYLANTIVLAVLIFISWLFSENGNTLKAMLATFIFGMCLILLGSTLGMGHLRQPSCLNEGKYYKIVTQAPIDNENYLVVLEHPDGYQRIYDFKGPTGLTNGTMVRVEKDTNIYRLRPLN